MIGHRRRDACAVRKQADEQSFLFGIGVYVQEVPPGEDFSASVKQPEATGVGDLIQNATMFLIAQLAQTSAGIIHWKAVIAMSAFQRTAMGDLNRSI